MKRVLAAAFFAGVLMASTTKSFADDSPATTYAQSSNALAVDLYKQVSGDPSTNMFFSPYSIDTALLMVAQGARGKTADEFTSVLHLGPDPALTQKGLGDLTPTLKGDGKTFSLTLANGIWVEKGFPILPAFLQSSKQLFNVDTIFPANFSGNAEAERQTINTWVLDHTNKKIADLIPEKAISDSTRMVLANAIYFKAPWDEPFSKDATANEPFHLAAGTDVTAPLMHMTHSFSYGKIGDAQILSLGYRTSEEGGSALSMVILLPANATALPALEKSLTPDALTTALQSMNYGRVNLTLPRFKITQSLSLADALDKLGLKSAFTTAADFSGITEPATLDQKISISAVVHKAFIDLNEEGTEAAAATAVIMRAGSARVQQPPIDFRADHPFLFLIRDDKTGLILFMGRVADPTKG